MRAFFIGLQFLTRISIVRQDNWTAEDFGRSVKFFPLIGAVLWGDLCGVRLCVLRLASGAGRRAPAPFDGGGALDPAAAFDGRPPLRRLHGHDGRRLFRPFP